MDVFDRRILSVLRGEKAKYFEQILSEAAFSPEHSQAAPRPAHRPGPDREK